MLAKKAAFLVEARSPQNPAHSSVRPRPFEYWVSLGVRCLQRAANPMPLIIPCHRVIHSDGKIGGFSAAGGISLKKRMLLMEHHTVTS
ncbi:MAG TPA: MGMT family protein [Sedimentisphaerales bacterium]|nr:MGMT family protein [Sedimentisphaerales bacterium]